MTNFILFSLFRVTCLLILSFENLWASNFLITFLSIHVIFKRVLYITFVCQRSEWLLFIANSAIFFSYIIARTGQFSMRWWWGSLCIRTAHLVGFFFIVLAHRNNSLRIDMSPHSDTVLMIILIPSQPVFVLSP